MGLGICRESSGWVSENLHCLTVREEVELRIDMFNENGTARTWTYSTFLVHSCVNLTDEHIPVYYTDLSQLLYMYYHAWLMPL